MTDTENFKIETDPVRIEELRLYTQHLEQIRVEDARRTALLMEMLAASLAPKPPEPETDADKADRLKDKRDWFAGQCVSNLLFNNGLKAQDVAKLAYAVADAMLAEREK